MPSQKHDRHRSQRKRPRTRSRSRGRARVRSEPRSRSNSRSRSRSRESSRSRSRSTRKNQEENETKKSPSLESKQTVAPTTAVVPVTRSENLPLWVNSIRPFVAHRRPPPPPGTRKTAPLANKYEWARARGLRATSLAVGATPLVDLGTETDPLKIAGAEMWLRKSKQVIRRYMPSGEFEDWPLAEMIFPEGSDEYANLLLPNRQVS